jgi:hypothetical protein
MKANLYNVYDKDNYGDTSAHKGPSVLALDRCFERLKNNELDDSITPRIPFNLESVKAESFTASSQACALNRHAPKTPFALQLHIPIIHTSSPSLKARCSVCWRRFGLKLSVFQRLQAAEWFRTAS